MALRTRDQVIADVTAPGQRFEIVPISSEPGSARRYRHAMGSLREVLLSAQEFADRDFIVYQDVRWTFAEHHRRVARFAHHLSGELGVQRGDRIAIAMRNLPEWSVAFWATQVIGAVAVPLNAWWTGAELAFSLRDSGARVLIADAERLERLGPLLADLGLDAVIVAGRGAAEVTLPGVERFDDVSTPTADGDPGLPDVAVGPDDLSTIVYTSGTTGTPKGATHLHRNHCAAVMNNLMFVAVGNLLAEAATGVAVGGTAAAVDGTADAPQPAALLTFPLFHVAGIVNLYLPMATGSKLVLLYRWDTETAVDVMLEEGVTSTVVVPTVLRQILESERLRDDPRLRLASIAAGGASVPGELVRRIATFFDDRVAPGNGYGLTETTAGLMSSSGADYVDHPDSIGRPFPVIDVRIVDDRGVDVEPGVVGELWVRGPTVVPGYWNNPTATAESFTGDWFHTGDLGRCDAEGRYYIVDRIKDVVIRGGENVYCAEVESVLAAHGSVQEVAVFGLPDVQLGEAVVAVVRLGGADHPDESALRAFVGERLAYFKVPSRIVEWDDELPKTASGKVLKRDIRAQILSTNG